MTEKNLKPGWRWVRLGDVVENINDFFDHNTDKILKYVAGEHIDEGSLKVRRYGLTSDDLIPPTFNRLFKAGDVLFHSRNIKKLAQPDFDGLTGEKLFVLRTKDQAQLIQDFLPFMLQSNQFGNYVQERWAGSTNKFLNKTPLMAYELRLPPIEEQHRLLQLLHEVEESLIAILEAYEAVVLLEASRLESVFETIPTDRQLKLEQLLTEGPRNGMSPKVNSDEKGYPTLSISAVRDGRIIAEGNVKYAEITADQADKFELKFGDVLVVRGNGNKWLTGKCGLVEYGMPKGCFFPDLLIRLKFDESIIRPRFAALQWNSATAHKRLVSRAKSTNGIWKINGADIRHQVLKVPSLAEQDALLSEIDIFRRVRSEIEQRKIKVNAIKALALREIA